MIAVINARTMAVSEYNIPGVIDVFEHDGDVYLVTSDSLMKQQDDGNGSPGTITTGELNLSGEDSVALNLAHLELQTDGLLHLSATAHQDGSEKTTSYPIPARPGSKARHRKPKLGNGISGNAWKFSLSSPGAAACNWSLSSWILEPSAARIRRM